MSESHKIQAEIMIDRSEVILKRKSAVLELEQRLQGGPASVKAHELIRALQDVAGHPIPPAVLAHLRDRLEQTDPKPSGRPTTAKVNPLKDELIYQAFMRYKDWLQARQKTQGLNGWRQIRGAHWWKGPPAERAARMVLRRWDFSMQWESVQKLAYKFDKQHRET